MTIISPKHFSAYIQCPYKAYLLLHTTEAGQTNEYENLVLKLKRDSQAKFLEDLPVNKYEVDLLKKGHEYIQDVKINTDEFEFNCSLLVKQSGKSSLGKFYYEPVLFIGLNQVTKEDKLDLAFLGLILEKVQNRFPEKGTIINQSGKEFRVELTRLKRRRSMSLRRLSRWNKKPTQTHFKQALRLLPVSESM